MNRSQRKNLKSILKMKRCRYCKATENLTLDHKIPIIQGGTEKLSNLQCLCKRCNMLKSGLSNKKVKSLWRWFNTIQKEREERGKKPYFKNEKNISNNWRERGT